MDEEGTLTITGEQELREKVYVIRGQQVMLDFDLAAIYGYTTKAFNQQVKRNADKFPDDFMFRLREDELDLISSRSQFVTLNESGNRRGSNIKYLPYAFTEQGIYMLMTVLKGELATRQSIALVRLFKGMKDYLADNQAFLSQKGVQELFTRSDNHERRLQSTEEKLDDLIERMNKAEDALEVARLFSEAVKTGEVLILNNQFFKADLAYQHIYEQAAESILVIDNYLGAKTLQHLAHAQTGISIFVASDNKGRHPLQRFEYDDFLAEHPQHMVTFVRTCGKVHDRYIILDHDTGNMRVFHCGASSKDAGSSMTSITELHDVDAYRPIVKQLLANQTLKLK